jgi:hypothetical protein
MINFFSFFTKNFTNNIFYVSTHILKFSALEGNQANIFIYYYLAIKEVEKDRQQSSSNYMVLPDTSEHFKQIIEIIDRLRPYYNDTKVDVKSIIDIIQSEILKILDDKIVAFSTYKIHNNNQENVLKISYANAHREYKSVMLEEMSGFDKTDYLQNLIDMPDVLYNMRKNRKKYYL